MARDDVLEPIRVRAYYLWERAGRPAGGDLAFWDEARRQIEAEHPPVPPAVPGPDASRPAGDKS